MSSTATTLSIGAKAGIVIGITLGVFTFVALPIVLTTVYFHFKTKREQRATTQLRERTTVISEVKVPLNSRVHHRALDVDTIQPIEQAEELAKDKIRVQVTDERVSSDDEDERPSLPQKPDRVRIISIIIPPKGPIRAREDLAERGECGEEECDLERQDTNTWQNMRMGQLAF